MKLLFAVLVPSVLVSGCSIFNERAQDEVGYYSSSAQSYAASCYTSFAEQSARRAAQAADELQGQADRYAAAEDTMRKKSLTDPAITADSVKLASAIAAEAKARAVAARAQVDSVRNAVNTAAERCKAPPKTAVGGGVGPGTTTGIMIGVVAGLASASNSSGTK